MARTYWAEGRQIANLIHAVGVIVGAFVSITLDSFLLFFVVVAIFSITGGILGSKWTNHRRRQRDLRKQAARRSKNPERRMSKEQYHPISTTISLSGNDLLKADIDTLSGSDFEKLMAMYYKWKGYDVKIIGGSGDHGVDLVLRGKDGHKIAVQCKRWKENIGNGDVLKVSAGKRMHDCLEAWFVTTSYYTPRAKEAAERHRVKLINGIEVHDMINNMKKHYGISRSKAIR